MLTRKSHKIFIVEDDPWYGEILAYHLRLNPDFDVERFETAKECLAHLTLQPDLISIDLSLPDMKGEQLFKKIREYLPDVPVIIISAQEDISVAVELLKMGVTDYLVKDDATKDTLWNIVNKILEERYKTEATAPHKKIVPFAYSFEKLIVG